MIKRSKNQMSKAIKSIEGNFDIKPFQTTFNKHGYGFQYSILGYAEKLYEKGSSPWRKPIPEFPVQVQGKDARIDLLLEHKSNSYLIVAECKRVNPALSNWFFAKASYVPKTRNSLGCHA